MYSYIYTGFIFNPRRIIEPTSHIPYHQWSESQVKYWNDDDWIPGEMLELRWLELNSFSRRTCVMCTVLHPHIKAKIDWFFHSHNVEYSTFVRSVFYIQMESSPQFAVLKVLYHAMGTHTEAFSISGPKFLSDRIKSMLKNKNIRHQWRAQLSAEYCESEVEVHTLLNWITSSSPGWLLQTMSSSMTAVNQKEDTFLFKSKEWCLFFIRKPSAPNKFNFEMVFEFIHLNWSIGTETSRMNNHRILRVVYRMEDHKQK